jgi:chromosome segregation ATPase
LTPFPRSRYDWSERGDLISDGERSNYDFERLEGAVESFVERHQLLRNENAAARVELTQCHQRIRQLEVELRDANQRRQDVGKHIDELIAQIDQLDAQFESQGEI